MALMQCNFFSDVLGLTCSMNVILPQATTTQIGMTGKTGRTRRHRVLYLLHGLSDDHTIWLRRTSIERYVSELGLAVVMPAVNRSYYTDMKHGGRYWTFVSRELPTLVESFFPISDKREDTFVAGLSMGGYGAFKMALSRPEKFAAAASLSGALDPMKLLHIRDGEWRREHTDIFGTRSFYGTGNDLVYLARKVARSRGPKPRLFQCCGTEDFLIEDNHSFRDMASALKMDFTYEQGPGNHSWEYWDTNIQRVLDWLKLR